MKLIQAQETMLKTTQKFIESNHDCFVFYEERFYEEDFTVDYLGICKDFERDANVYVYPNGTYYVTKETGDYMIDYEKLTNILNDLKKIGYRESL